MNKSSVKVIAMYLPQYHETELNNSFWGEGYTDWVGVKKSEPQFSGHIQPKVPLNQRYYDLSHKEDILWQMNLAQKYGIYGFGIYHYWFPDRGAVLNTPAEIILKNPELHLPFCFAWDNISWKRTWSRKKGNDWVLPGDSKNGTGPELLLEHRLGGKDEWKAHFDYLLPFFKDERYICSDGHPLFMFYHREPGIEEMMSCWNDLAEAEGIPGLLFVFRADPVQSAIKGTFSFSYEPQYSGIATFWQRGMRSIHRKLGIKKLYLYNYDKIWKKILRGASRQKSAGFLYGAFVSYDDTPRRAGRATVVTGGSPEKFEVYLRKLVEISASQKKEFIFLTAWNEWGEGAYLEPDEISKTDYLEAVQAALR